MSLKAFHVVFIAFAVLLAFALGGWLVDRYLQWGGAELAVLAVVSFLTGLGLMVYERHFLKKTREIGYL